MKAHLLLPAVALLTVAGLQPSRSRISQGFLEPKQVVAPSAGPARGAIPAPEQIQEKLPSTRAVVGGGSGPTANQADQLMLTDPEGCVVWDIRPSPDGSRVVYTNHCFTGAVVVRDLATGDTTVLADDAWYNSPTWSPSGSQIAVRRMRPGVPGPGDQARVDRGLRILDAHTGADRTPAAVAGMPLTPRSWVGSLIAGGMREGDGSGGSTVVLSLRDARVVRFVRRINQEASYPNLSPDGRYLAFVGFVDGNQRIFVATVEGTEARPVTSGPGQDAWPLWSPDGDYLAYQGEDGLWVVPMTGGTASGAPFRIREEPNWPTAWTEKGIYYVVENWVTELLQIPVDPETGRQAGTEERMPALLEGGAPWMAWSPDMNRLAMGGGDDVIRIYSRLDETVRKIQMGAEIRPTLIWWSADGREILFTTAARAMRDNRKTVFALEPGDGGVRELFPRLDSVAHLHLSPDSRKMTFITNLTGRGPKELRVTDVGSSEGTVLASSPSPEGGFSGRYGQPVFSPDGSDVLVLRTRGTAPEEYGSALWIVPSDGSASGRMLVSSTGGFFMNAFWAPDGRFVAFTHVNTSTGRGAVSVVSVESGQRNDIVTFDYQRGSAELEVALKYWSPDGRYLGITRRTGQNEYWLLTDMPGRSRSYKQNVLQASTNLLASTPLGTTRVSQ